MKEPTIKVRHALVLEFTLPGVRGSYRTSEGGFRGTGILDTPTQLERLGEAWQIEIDGHNGAETRDVLRSLATQIDVALSEGRLPR